MSIDQTIAKAIAAGWIDCFVQDGKVWGYATVSDVIPQVFPEIEKFVTFQEVNSIFSPGSPSLISGDRTREEELSVNDYFMGTDLSALAPWRKPTKPRLGHNPTVEEAKEYAQKLEEYPKELEEWESEIAPIQAQIKARHKEFYLYFLEDVGICPDHPKAKKLYELCWEEGHSEGYQNVIELGQYWSEVLD